MEDLIRNYRLLFPVFFLVMWLAVSTLLAFMSGWYFLMQRYPDRNEPAALKLTRQSGQMGLVSMGGILNLAVVTPVCGSAS